MSKTVVIHQPDFLPYLGFFHRLLHADLFVILDTVQFVRSSRSWHKRDKIKTAQGEAWISVDTRRTNRDAAINTILLSEEGGWRAAHQNQIKHNYAASPYYAEIMPHVERLYAYACDRFMDFTLESIRIILDLFDIHVQQVCASALAPVGHSNELLVDILSKVGATTYLSGIGARDYFQASPFDAAGIRVEWQRFQHPVYPQQYGEFIPYLSSIDLLFNCGIEQSRKILRKGCNPL